MKPNLSFRRVEPALVERARGYSAAVLCDVAGRRGMMHSRIRALDRSMRVAGPAFTVEVRPGDNLMFHVALALARPGDIIVVDGKADMTCALFGELMVAQAAAANLGGFVVDAASRDTLELLRLSFPIFSIGSTPGGPTKAIPGRMLVPVSVGEIAVMPGDLVVADADGVTVIPIDDVEAVLDAAEAKLADEQARLGQIARGELVPQWLHSGMAKAGLPPLEEFYAANKSLSLD